MNLVLGILCLVGAAVLLGQQFLLGDRRFVIRGTDLSAGWLLLLLAGWNFARWWNAYSWRVQQQRLREQHAVRLRQIRDHDRPPPDPTFDFTDGRPAPPASEPRPGPPQS